MDEIAGDIMPESSYPPINVCGCCIYNQDSFDEICVSIIRYITDDFC